MDSGTPNTSVYTGASGDGRVAAAGHTSNVGPSALPATHAAVMAHQPQPGNDRQAAQPAALAQVPAPGTGSTSGTGTAAPSYTSARLVMPSPLSAATALAPPPAAATASAASAADSVAVPISASPATPATGGRVVRLPPPVTTPAASALRAARSAADRCSSNCTTTVAAAARRGALPLPSSSAAATRSRRVSGTVAGSRVRREATSALPLITAAVMLATSGDPGAVPNATSAPASARVTRVLFRVPLGGTTRPSRHTMPSTTMHPGGA